MGLILWELAEMLNHPTISRNPRAFVTAAGIFMTDKILKVSNTMLPCLSK